jgi:peptidoglycan/xylan/chitin deacetylase (PgdA/CDA1 family)
MGPSTADGGKPPVDTSKDAVTWPDNSMVPHLFFHSLVIDPKRAFSDPESGKGYLDYMVTQREFAKVLQQVYDKGYVLVSPHQLATVEANGRIKPKTLKLPNGKKPLVISVDDVSYYEYMQGDGFATNLVIADNGRVLNTYTDAAGKTTRDSYDVMPMVDDFVREHPDFSHAGARGVIALTGYNGVFGYRSSPSEYAGKNPNLKQDIATATKVATALKSEGWEFASHSWGHINFTKSSVDHIRADNNKWKADVEPIVGPTDLLVYPFGADISGVAHYQGAKYDYLKGQGFSFYFNVDGSTPAWGQWGDGYLREARINVDGISIKAAVDGRKVLSEFFDVKSVLDPARLASISGS